MFRERKVRAGYRVNAPSSIPPSTNAGAISPLPVSKMAAPPAPVIDRQWELDRTNPLRRKLFYFALATIFIRFSVIHEALAVALNLNLYLLYIVLPPTILGIFATGGIRRTLKARSARFWMAFLMWLYLATLFSTWRGGSAAEVFAYTRSEFLMLFVIAGMVMTWKECKLVMYTLAAAGLTTLVIGRTFMFQDVNRVDLRMGGSTIGNANDLAAHLILLTPFLLYLLMAPRIPTLLRLSAIPTIGYSLFMIASTASRGAIVALTVCSLFSFFIGSSKFRIMSFVALPVAALAIITLLPRSTLLRLSNFSSSEATAGSDIAREAEGSAAMRQQLLKKSIQYTIQHPMFGVGPAQFASYEGGEDSKNGHRGMWHQTHNFFTQISSECGIPALVLFICAIVSAFRLLLKTHRLARTNPANADIAAVTFCIMLGIVGFLSAAFFLNLAYRFYEPAFCGLCIAIYSAAQHEMADRKARAASMPPPAPQWSPAQFASQSWGSPPPAFSNTLR